LEKFLRERQRPDFQRNSNASTRFSRLTSILCACVFRCALADTQITTSYCAQDNFAELSVVCIR